MNNDTEHSLTVAWALDTGALDNTPAADLWRFLFERNLHLQSEC